jgi:hypothetical protein
VKYVVKRLAAVEVAQRGKRNKKSTQAGTSNQHEFNAGTVRTTLDLPERCEGALSLLFFTADQSAPVEVTTTYTLYDSRKAKAATRSPEYRLYYHAKDALQEYARAGDVFVVFRTGDAHDLVGIVARAGTRVEQEILQALELDPTSALTRFAARQQGAPSSMAGIAAATMSALAEDAARADVLKSREAYMQPIIEGALANGKIPQARALSAASQEFVLEHLDNLTPDEFIDACLSEESMLFFAVEKAVNQPKLEELVARGVDLGEVLSWSLRLQQSRKARRGQSLQFHFESLLKREGIPFKAQCVTENGERPDFVIPGEAEYHDLGFPPEGLRMVACKTTVRERWGQVSKEAARIPEKYLLTVDEQLPAEVLASIAHHSIKTFAPASVIEARGYDNVESVDQLIERLRVAVREVQERTKQ